jgi:hypothetical protein
MLMEILVHGGLMLAARAGDGVLETVADRVPGNGVN